MESTQELLGKFKEWATKAAAIAAEREAEAQRVHLERMAALPLGTCETCYGTTSIPGQYGIGTANCPECNPPIVHAEGVPYEFRSARFDNFRDDAGNRSALVKARVFFDGERDLFLSGGVGAGKTRLACSIANECALRRKRTLFVRVPMALHQLQPGRDAGEIAELERRLFETNFLVLDDIGAERDQATDYTRRTLLMIYEERCDRGLRTIFTSNKTIQQLAEMQDDDRLASRIAGRADVVLLTTPDQRMATRKRVEHSK